MQHRESNGANSRAKAGPGHGAVLGNERALSALEGTRIAERLLRACGTGLKFSAAMEKVTGHTLEAWTPILTAYVETVMAGKPLTVVELEGLRRSTFAK